jgi:hypothetical protein
MVTGRPPHVGTAPDGAVPVLPRTLATGVVEESGRFREQPFPVPRAGAGRRTCRAAGRFVVEVPPTDG